MGVQIDLHEVGPRDGLQNEKGHICTKDKIELVRRLAASGLRSIEITACVSPKWIPQMADHREVIAGVGAPPPGVGYTVLAPNLKGLESALADNIGTVAVLTAASEQFVRRNINCSRKESLDRCREVAEAADRAGKRVRGYVSTAVACPYAGPVPPKDVAESARALADMGCDEISLGDTIGIGTPRLVTQMLEAVVAVVPPERLAGHFHDTYGSAVANVAAALAFGIARFDSSAGGLGGCPYAPGAAGNAATEDLAHFVQGEGLDAGVDLKTLAETGRWCSELAGREYSAKAGLAALAGG